MLGLILSLFLASFVISPACAATTEEVIKKSSSLSGAERKNLSPRGGQKRKPIGVLHLPQPDRLSEDHGAFREELPVHQNQHLPFDSVRRFYPDRYGGKGRPIRRGRGRVGTGGDVAAQTA